MRGSFRKKTSTSNFYSKKKEDMTIEEYDKFLTRLNAKHHMRDHNIEVVGNLARFIKRNKQLIHFDLTQTNLTEYMLWKLGASLVRAKSLIAIHLCGNQGITPALKKHIHGRIRCKKLPEDFKMIIN